MAEEGKESFNMYAWGRDGVSRAETQPWGDPHFYLFITSSSR